MLRFDRHKKPLGHSALSNSRFLLHQYPGGQPLRASSCSVASSTSTASDNTPHIPNRRVMIVNWFNIPSREKIMTKVNFPNKTYTCSQLIVHLLFIHACGKWSQQTLLEMFNELRIIRLVFDWILSCSQQSKDPVCKIQACYFNLICPSMNQFQTVFVLFSINFTMLKIKINFHFQIIKTNVSAFASTITCIWNLVLSNLPSWQ